MNLKILEIVDVGSGEVKRCFGGLAAKRGAECPKLSGEGIVKNDEKRGN